jgi:hypothetical protein
MHDPYGDFLIEKLSLLGSGFDLKSFSLSQISSHFSSTSLGLYALDKSVISFNLALV